MAKSSRQRAKGDGGLYQEASGRWVGSIDIGYRDGKRQRKKVSASTQTECRRKLRALQRDIEEGIVTDRSTVAEWLDYWLDEICPHRTAEKTLYNYRRKIDIYVTPVIGRIKLKSLTPDDIRTVHKKMRTKGLSESTVRQVHVILSRALKVAEREGKIHRNPAGLTDPPSTASNPMAVLSVEDAKKLLRMAPGPREAARLTCALVLGLRQGEALALKWDDIDFSRSVLRIDESIGQVPGVGFVTKDPKTKSGRRDVPMPPAVAAVMHAWYTRSAGESDYVFPGLKGGPEGQKRDWKAWRDALDRAGVPPVKLHGARGTAASLLLDMGVPERVIADILGHADVRVTMAHYLHSTDEQRGAALDGLADKLGIAPIAPE